MNWLVPILIASPLAVGAILLVVQRASLRNAIVVAASVALMAGSVATVSMFGNGGVFGNGGESGNGGAVFFGLPGGLSLEAATVAAEVVLAGTVIGFGVAYRRYLSPAMAAGQLLISGYLVIGGHLPEPDPSRLFWFDRLTVVMVLVIGIIGPLICIQAVGYMRDYHRANPMVKGRRTVFFALLFIFLGAMFGLVVANDLPMMLVFWEMTTLCSFLLIGYTRTEQTLGYAFRALNMNMVGGLAFSVAILFLAGQHDGLDLARLTSGPASGVLVPAVALLALGGLTKSAQMPFSDWLLGAMYAPTPTSALLHSSTMVKAGVFLLLRLSPAMSGSLTGTLVAVVGMATFLFVSLVAVTEQNVKLVLAYSTIGYLGLITGCAGVGTPQAIWVGVMIVIFHAIAKGLMFLVVGTVESRLYTKDVELFDALLSRLPRVSVLALAGIAGMFVAPFGIVVAKWAAIRAFLQAGGWEGSTFVVITAFASALTIFYWGKLLIKVLSMRAVPADELAIEKRVSRYEWWAESGLAAGVVMVAALLGVLSDHLVAPFATSVFPANVHGIETVSPVVIAVMLLAILFLPVLASWAVRRKSYDEADFYAGGRNTSADRAIGGALGVTRTVSLRGYYLDGVIDGALVFRAGTAVCGAALVAMTLVGLVAR